MAATAAKPYDHLMKVVLISAHNKATGKTSIAHRITNNEFKSGRYDQTIGVEFQVQTFTFDPLTSEVPPLDSSSSSSAAAASTRTQQKSSFSPSSTLKIKLQMWDCASSDRYSSITRSYWRGCHIVFFVFAYDDMESFQQLPERLEDFRKIMDPSEYDQACKVLVGNKSDVVQQQVTKSEVDDMMTKEDFDVSAEVSCITGDGFQELLCDVISFIGANGYQHADESRSIPAFAGDVGGKSSPYTRKRLDSKKPRKQKGFFPTFGELFGKKR